MIASVDSAALLGLLAAAFVRRARTQAQAERQASEPARGLPVEA